MNEEHVGEPRGESFEEEGLEQGGFAEETRAYLQSRLRLAALVFAAVVGIALVVLIGVVSLSGGSIAEGLSLLVRRPGPMFAALVLLAAVFAVAARHHPFSTRALSLVDLLFFELLCAALLSLLVSNPYFSDPVYVVVVPALVATILTRAVFVPSSFWRTWLFSSTVPVAVLVANLALDETRMIQRLQVSDGANAITATNVAYPREHFVFNTLFNQIVLWWAVLVAALASQVNVVLRRRVHEAGRLGPYELGPMIGSGAMGQVYRATHALLKRPTAIKFLRPEITGTETLARFEREVQQTSRLSHPNNVSIYDYGRTSDGVFYYAMELLEGVTLRVVVEEFGPQPAARVVRILAAALGALAEAHGKGMVHRDVKTDNLMLCRQGGELDVVKLLDFGLVKDLGGDAKSLTLEGLALGTPETMAPEVLSSQAVGPRADVYSLCAVGYTLLTGELLFPAHSVGEFLDAHRNVEPEPPSRHRPVPADVERAILSGLRKSPGERPSASDLRSALLACGCASDWDPRSAEAWWEAFESGRRGA